MTPQPSRPQSPEVQVEVPSDSRRSSRRASESSGRSWNEEEMLRRNPNLIRLTGPPHHPQFNQPPPRRSPRLQSRASTSASEMSEDGARWDGEQDQGMQKIVNPLVAGVRMSLRPEKYDKNSKNRASKAIKKLGQDESIAKAVKEQLMLMGYGMPYDSDDEDNSVDEIIQLDEQLRFAPAQSQEKLDKISKRLWSEYPQKFSENHQDLGTFLNEFAESMNLNSVNHAQAKSLLKRHFNSKLKAHLKANEELGLPKILNNLRLFKCKRESLNSMRTKLANWNIDQDDIRGSIFDLKTMMIRSWPGYTIPALETPIKEKVLSQLPENIRNEMTEAETKHRRKMGYPLDVEKFAVKLEKIWIPKKRKTTANNNIGNNHRLFTEQEVNSLMVRVREEERAKAQEASSAMTQQVQAQSQPQSSQTQPTNIFFGNPPQNIVEQLQTLAVNAYAPKFKPPQFQYGDMKKEPEPQKRRQIRFLAEDDPEVEIAKLQIPKSELQGKFNTTPEYKYRIKDGKYIPLKPIQPFPEGWSRFAKGDDGKMYLTKKFIEYFENKCTSCSIENDHVANSSRCVYKNVSDGFDICPKCRIGLHSTCLLDDSANVYLQSKSGN